MFRCAITAVFLIASGPALAQVIGVGADPTYLAVNTSTVGGGVCNPPYCVNPSLGVPLNYFASQSAVAQQLASTQSQISAALDAATVAAAMKDAIPNHGDRFAVRINAAAMGSYAAGSIGASYNLNNQARVSLNYGRGRDQSVVSGGLNLSFR